jgi:hypothetical protein
MSMLRFLPGIVILEAAMVALVVAYMNASNEALLVPVGLLAMIITVLVAFWFASIADHIKKDAVARARMILCGSGKTCWFLPKPTSAVC